MCESALCGFCVSAVVCGVIQVVSTILAENCRREQILSGSKIARLQFLGKIVDETSSGWR